jgi:hypothetical protein
MDMTEREPMRLWEALGWTLSAFLRVSIVQAALGLWIIPWAPVFVALVVVASGGFSISGIIVVLFMLGWPATWYRWVLRGDEIEKPDA